ncbi:MAG: PepSY domain-containing protein [Acutalibacteraceae bacterium]
MKNTVWKAFGKKASAVLAGTLLAAGLTACGGTGGTAAAGDVTETEAASIAMEHAGVKEDDALSLRVSQEEEDGVAVYDVEFATADRRYHCDVVRSSGEVLNFSYNAVTSGDDQADDGAAAQTSGAQESSASAAQTDDASASSAQQSTASSGAIDEAQARSIALEHAGVAESDAKFYRVERDNDDGRAVYEVEFYSGNTEYDYEISAETGEILSYDSDIEGWAAQSASSTSGSAVTLEQARELVLERVPGAAASDVQIEQERDDGRDIYEGEVYYDRTEYEFEIDASTGSFIKWSVDYRD